MSVTLHITGEAARALGANSVKVFDEKGGTIGRSAGNDWMLPDPQRYLSGRHAAVYFEDGAYYLADTSANGVFYNGSSEPLGSDHPVRLNDGDQLVIGDYDMSVSLAAVPTSVELPPLDAIPESLDPLELLNASPRPAARAAPTPPVPPAAPPSARRPTTVTAASAARIGAGEFIPETLDPMDLLGGGAAAERAPSRPPGGGSQSDHAPTLEGHFKPPAAAGGLIPENWDLEGSDLTGRSAPTATVQSQPAATAKAAPAPPSPQPPPRPSTPAVSPPAPKPAPSATPPPVAAAPPVVAGGDVFWREFLRGARLQIPPGATVDAELAHVLGQLFRMMAGGLRDVLMARGELKSGFRMEMTRIRPKENNPLKFSAGGVEEAMHHLLFSAGSRYLPPIDAVHEGFNDIRNHQVAMMAGMRATFASLLKRFQPDLLEEQFAESGKRGGLFARGGRNWELYTAFYAKLLRQSDDDFELLFGEAFAKAYEDQISRLETAQRETESGTGETH